jgi:hypothetical protein
MPRICLKVLFSKRTIIWFYRFISITFGGIAVNSNGNLCINKYFKYYGFFGGFLITFLNVIAFTITISLLQTNSQQNVNIFTAMLKTGSELLHISVSLWFLIRNGFRFIEILFKLKMGINKNRILLFIIWIFHILLSIAIHFHNFAKPNHKIRIDSDFLQWSAIIIFNISKLFGSLAVWAVSFLMWMNSVYFYEVLAEIKQNLILETTRNTGFV